MYKIYFIINQSLAQVPLYAPVRVRYAIDIHEGLSEYTGALIDVPFLGLVNLRNTREIGHGS